MAESGKLPLVRQSFVTAGICVNILSHGCMVGFPAVLLPQLSRPGAAITLTADASSWLASLMMVPLLVGNFFVPSIMDRLGRKVAHHSVIIPAIAGWLALAMADSLTTLVIGRLLQGLSFGLMLPLRSAVIGEYTSPRFRGAFLMTVSLAQASGIFLVHLLGSFIDWQITALICVIFPFISLVITLYTPESPVYLASKGRIDECRDVFRWLRGFDEEEELEEMIEARSIELENENGGFREFLMTLKKKEFYKPVMIMIHANGMMQFAGGTTMAAYSTTIIALILGPSANASFWMIFLDGQRIVFNFLAVYVINKHKRRTMMISIGGLCVISHLAIAVYVYSRNSGIILYDAIWIPVALLNLQFFTVATGMVPLPNVIAGEIFPFQYRGVGGSVSVIAVSGFSFLVLKTFPTLSISIGIEGLYLGYALIMMYFLMVVWFMLPETKGKTLQQIEDEFRGTPRKVEEPLMVLKNVSSKTNVNRKMSVISNYSLVVEL
ncbi:facilitated trehalose transporter Tret1-like [Pectinophora gossypiella]|uniref:facilitated trehalose transporter Tret1-like n=1 Tax=Pectinophora gossypiella TaxID=13191 RepID=UPI00214F47DC|nr:facilitated trehalose transporter Tret1-like [Pectinophora gossypiella]